MPETYHLSPTSTVPNNTRPVLVYRSVLLPPVTSASAQEFLENNHWVKRGEWGAITTRHFHPNTHECYGIVRGNSTMRIGAGDDDRGEEGTLIKLSIGDVIVIPAGVSHHSTEKGDGEFRYIGVYPEAAPKWRNLYGKGEEDMNALKDEIHSVETPEWDPVEGKGGSLTNLWS